MKYIYDSNTNAFYPFILQKDYEASGMWPENGIEVDEATFLEFQNPPEGKIRAPDDEGNPSWVNIPPIPSLELRKAALAALGKTYQADIEKLNRAWLAASVNDGVNETAKKDVVLAQINTRKTQYATDRTAIIAQYPD